MKQVKRVKEYNRITIKDRNREVLTEESKIMDRVKPKENRKKARRNNRSGKIRNHLRRDRSRCSQDNKIGESGMKMQVKSGNEEIYEYRRN